MIYSNQRSLFLIPQAPRPVCPLQPVLPLLPLLTLSPARPSRDSDLNPKELCHNTLSLRKKDEDQVQLLQNSRD